MKKLYLMRHGETLFNQLGKIQGASDTLEIIIGNKEYQRLKKG